MCIKYILFFLPCLKILFVACWTEVGATAAKKCARSPQKITPHHDHSKQGVVVRVVCRILYSNIRLTWAHSIRNRNTNTQRILNMCILLSTVSHPDYPIILLSNRDEYFARPTQRASLKKLANGSELLAPADLARPEHGTWIGITSDGKLAVLVNYREEHLSVSRISRGLLPIEFLQSEALAEEWHHHLDKILALESIELNQVGGFLLLYGKLLLTADGTLKPLYLMSNRGDRGKVHSTEIDEYELHGDFARQRTFGLSNSLYYMPWPKVELGRKDLESKIKTAVENHVSEEELIESCFEVLSRDTFDNDIRKNGTFDQKMTELKNSVFIPPLETPYAGQSTENGYAVGKYYGTRTQTVIALHKSGTLHYHERDLYTGDTTHQDVHKQHYKFII